MQLYSHMKRATLNLFFLSIILTSCGKENTGELRAVVEKEIVVFEGKSFPTELGNLFSTNDIMIFGETHYVQEHQQYIVDILPELSARGYKVIFQELFNSFNWMIEDYLNGNIEELPEPLLYFDETLIDGIKSFNETVAEAARISLVYMDVNQWTDNFSRSVEEMTNIIGDVEILTEIQALDPRSENYEVSLINFNNSMVNDKETYINQLGEIWYQRLEVMIKAELKSYRYRNNGSDVDREEFMKESIISYTEENPSNKVLINTGMFHGQKKTLMGNDIPRLGQLLANGPLKISSIAFIGLRGQSKDRFNDTQKEEFDLVDKASDNDLVKIIDETASQRISYLPLTDDQFNMETTISYTRGNTIKAPIGQQFDVIITYPEISVLNSMDIYDWRK